ncbi:MAG: malate/lactate/ureidoglycolate dehydrogenase [Gaiella sp.]
MPRRIPPAELVDLATAIVTAIGSEPDEARIVADHLVEANLKGHDSHGVVMLPAYAKHAANGGLVPNIPLRMLEDGGAFLRFTGDMGYGQRVGLELMDVLIARARETGAVVATLRETHHLCRIGAYAERAADAGLVSVHVVNVTGHAANVAPHRGAEPRFGTNPYTIAFPGTADSPPVLIDLATSAIALGKAVVAANRGELVAPGVLIDSAGRPTTDPKVLFPKGDAAPGALLPFALHKGYALQFGAELLAGVLAGGGAGNASTRDRETIVNSMFVVVLDPARFVDGDWLETELDGLRAYAVASRPADPALPVLVPGDPERAASSERSVEGIPVDGTTWAKLQALAGA